MLKISGLIVNRTNRKGIPRIVVTGYDCALSAEEIGSNRPTGAMLKALGRRLGSVMTDDVGWFEFSTDDLAYEGNESRPDLALIAFAPEDIDDPSLPFPAPPERRILYMTVVPRTTAGAEEVFHIRLSPSQLAKFGLEPETEALAGSLEGAWHARDALAERLKERADAERRHSEKRQEQVREKTQHLSAVPHALRKNKLLALSKRDLEGQREAMQMRAIEEGLTRWSNSLHPPEMLLYLDQREMVELGLAGKADVEDEGAAEVEATPISGNTLFKKLAAVGQAPELVLKRLAPSPRLDELEARYLSVQPVSLSTHGDDHEREEDADGSDQ